mgnify:CR=1 FL=1
MSYKLQIDQSFENYIFTNNTLYSTKNEFFGPIISGRLFVFPPLWVGSPKISET